MFGNNGYGQGNHNNNGYGQGGGNPYQNGRGQGGPGGFGGKSPFTLIAIVVIVLFVILTRTGAISGDFIKYIVAGIVLFVIIVPMFSSRRRGPNGPQGPNGGNYQNNNYNNNYNNNNNNRYY